VCDKSDERKKEARAERTQEEDVCDKREEHQFRLLGIKINLSHIHTLGILREDTDLSLSVYVCKPCNLLI
jgi:hypothetical protein